MDKCRNVKKFYVHGGHKVSLQDDTQSNKYA